MFEWEEVAIYAKGKVKLGKVDRHKESSLARMYAVKYSPTIKVWKHGEGKNHHTIKEYSGELHKEELINYVDHLWEKQHD